MVRLPGDRTERRKSNAAIGFGTSFAGGMAVFAIGGHWLDTRYDQSPWFTLVGVLLGFVFGGWELWKLVSAANRRIADEDMQARKEQDGGDQTHS